MVKIRKRIDRAWFRRALALSSAAAFLLSGAVTASALTVTQNADIGAGQTAFGPTRALFSWENLFPVGTIWAFGSLGPMTASGADPMTGNTVVGPVNIANWIDGNGFSANGIGFNASSGAATADLAFNGAENFSFNLSQPVGKIGFAVATGISNLTSEIDHLGTLFQVATDTGEVGSFTLADAGTGYSAWVTVEATVPFRTLTFSEPSGNISDQYFGNVVTSVPEPGSRALLFLGFAGLAAARRGCKTARVAGGMWRRVRLLMTPTAAT